MIRWLNKIVFLVFIGIIISVHAFSNKQFMHTQVSVDSQGYALLQEELELNKKFRKGSFFTRAVYDGYNKFTHTPENASRFVANDKSCSSCHSHYEMGYAFVSMDRYNSLIGKRISFEEQVARCYVKHLNGHVPPFYDPAIQNIKIFARFMSIGMGLQEGALKKDIYLK